MVPTLLGEEAAAGVGGRAQGCLCGVLGQKTIHCHPYPPRARGQITFFHGALGNSVWVSAGGPHLWGDADRAVASASPATPAQGPEHLGLGVVFLLCAGVFPWVGDLLPLSRSPLYRETQTSLVREAWDWDCCPFKSSVSGLSEGL